MKKLSGILTILLVCMGIPITMFGIGRVLQKKSNAKKGWRIMKWCVVGTVFTWSILRYTRLVSFSYNQDPLLLGDFAPRNRGTVVER